MFKTILRSGAANIRRLLYIWLAVLVANQLFIFGACFAPYCLAAAVPHTVAIALLVNFFGFKREETDTGQPPLGGSSTPSMKPVSRVNYDAAVGNGYASRRPAARKGRVASIAVYLLIALCIGLGLLAENSFRALESPADDHMAEVEPNVDAEGDVDADQGSPAQAFRSAQQSYDEPSDARATLAEREAYLAANGELPDEHLSLAQRRKAQAAATASRARMGHVDNDDEFDINDIEQYERLTKKKYRGSTNRRNQQLYVEGDEPDATGADAAQAATTRRAGAKDESLGRPASTRHAYQCANSSGRGGLGTGRPTREGEYSAFLRKSVHADEFVVFQYEGSTKEYFFKSSNCQQL